MKQVRKIELLAPAKDWETGVEAIDHGADAVYIGAPRFSARSAAGNSLDDIRNLTEYAHLFHAKVYVALNTILDDSELAEAEKMILGIYRAGADAIIIQDMGILNLNLPPIAFHASTQTDNRTVEKARFLEEAGFAQIVLARELSLSEIREIAGKTKAALEVFVHGALCTSFSGQCYISRALSGRSANRGECAQYCRLPYTLLDAGGNVVASNRHWLSMKDLNQSEHLEELLDAGVSALKIEGRLKDRIYVKNVTAYYRKKLDEIFARRPEYQPSSSGKTVHYFTPDPQKTFNRGFTTYFLHGRNKEIVSPETPKSLGEPAGNVRDLSSRSFTLQGSTAIHNGDGLCFINEKKELQGFRVNRAEGNRIFPAQMPRLNPGTALYRNQDAEFEKCLSQKSAERKIDIEWILEENNFGFTLSIRDEDLYSASITAEFPKELSKTSRKACLEEPLAKLGNTPFRQSRLVVRMKENYFIPASLLSEMRRKAVKALLRARKIAIPKPLKKIQIGKHPYPENTLDYSGNVFNEKARNFYRQHGVEKIAAAFEALPLPRVPLMTTKYCIRYQLGYCPGTKEKGQTLKEPLTLLVGKKHLTLKFDCLNCQMQIIHG
ncbi:MAG: U32 family peptidase [Candidatus Symbiothrix sp.]|jgi:putative protease|nr:U32 family peptidase [Candidatus Symbiothrix sp.]